MCRRVTAYRASKILYNFLKSNQERITEPFLLPANVCVNVPQTFDDAGVTYRFVDIEADTLCMSKKAIMQQLDSISGIVMVHTYGLETDFSDFYQQLRKTKPELLIVDDRCLCVPSFEQVMYNADIVLYSFAEKKQVNLGNGAFAYISDNANYTEYAAPIDSFLTNETWQMNVELCQEQCRKAIAHRDALNAIYRANLPKEIQMPEDYQHWRFNILVENKQEILEAIFAAGFFASSHYKVLTGGEEMPCAVDLSDRVINLFNDSYFTEAQAKKCVEIIKLFSHNVSTIAE